MKSLTVIMTALNEQNNIKEALLQMHEALSSSLNEFRIVVIDDGSSDRTYENATELNLPHVKVLRNERNLGTGKSVSDYFPFIETDFYCWYPTDLELSPYEIAKALLLIEDHDIVVSFITGDERSLWRRFLSKTFTQILNLSFGRELPYYNGVSLIRRELLPEKSLISSRRFFTHAEILILSMKEGVKLTTVGFTLFPRSAGESKAMRLNAFWDVGVNYLKLLSKKMRS